MGEFAGDKCRIEQLQGRKQEKWHQNPQCLFLEVRAERLLVAQKTGDDKKQRHMGHHNHVESNLPDGRRLFSARI